MLPVASNNTIELIHFANKALDIIFRKGYNFNKCGCIANDLIPEEQIQYSMFDGLNRKKIDRLMESIDNINGSFRKDILRFAWQGYGKKWKLRQAKLSPCYTTRIDEILTIEN